MYAFMPAAARPRDGRPIVLMTPWRRHLPTFLGERTELDTLHPPYGDRIASAGGVALTVPRPPGPHGDEVLIELLDLADGLMLTGGGDVDPHAYGDEDQGALLVDPEADAWEIRLVRAAAARRLPTLGICRGAQIMAVAFGGRLLQDLTEDAEHGDLLELEPEQVLANRHWVELLPGSLLREVFGASRVYVNTIHRHAVADAGALAATGLASGGLIEAVEAAGPLAGWPALGVQWHPEKMDDPQQRRLFRHLVRSAAAYREQAGATGALT
jgi:putative glutamine amidotransferase